MICLVGGCGYAYRSRGGGHIRAGVGKGGQVWTSHTDQMRMGDMSSGWVWVCVQV